MAGISDLKVTQYILGKVNWGNARINLINQNLANANTPGFIPSDLSPFKIIDSKPSKESFKQVHIKPKSIHAAGGVVNTADQLALLQETYSTNVLLTSAFKRISEMYKTVLRK